MGGLRVYRDLLVGNGPLTRLLVGEFISGIGDWLYIVAIFVVIYQQSGNAALVGAFGAIRLLPYVFLSVPAGVIADRFDRRLVLLTSDLFRGSLMVVMAIVIAAGGPVIVVAGLAILAAGGSTFFYPAMGAYLPALARDERQLGPANSLWASIQNVSFIIGPAIGGIVLALGDPTAAFVLNAISFLFIAVILWRLPPSVAHPRSADDASTAPQPGEPSATLPQPAPMAAPARHPLELRPLAGLTVVELMAGFLDGGLQVLTVVLALDVLKAGEDANGYLNAGVGVGGLAGGILAGALVLRRGLGVPLLLGAVVTGLGAIALGMAVTLPVALVAIGVVAAGTLVTSVIGTTVFQRLVPDELRGRGMGVLMTVSTLTGAAGAFLLPVLVTGLGTLQSLAGVGIATIALNVVGIVLVGTAADRPPTPYEAVMDRVRHLPLFAGVPRSRLQAAMHRVVEVPTAAGQVVVRQGDVADRFYIIESGEFTVTQVQGGAVEPVTLRSLGPDQVFGELGLLNRTPRTATVTAETAGLLLALGRDDFLELVGAAGPLRGRLLGLYAGRPAPG